MELPFGCTLLKLVERKEFEPISYEEAKPMLQMEIFEMKVAEEFRKWMEELREQHLHRAPRLLRRRRAFGQSPFGGRPERAGGRSVSDSVTPGTLPRRARS